MKYPQVVKEASCQLRLWLSSGAGAWGISQHLITEVCVCVCVRALDDSALVAQCRKAAWTALL